MSEPDVRIGVRLSEETLPPRDPAHGTPYAMARRTLVFVLANGEARFEQTDYGHPGRFNPWDPRGVAPALQAKTEALLRAAEAIAELLA